MSQENVEILRRAIEHINQGIKSLRGVWNQMLMEIVEVIEGGGAVVVVLRERLRANSGVELEVTEGWATGSATGDSRGSNSTEARRRPSKPPGARNGRHDSGQSGSSLAMPCLPSCAYAGGCHPQAARGL